MSELTIEEMLAWYANADPGRQSHAGLLAAEVECLRSRIAKLEDQSRLREIDFALSETRVADLEMTLRPFAVGLIHRVEGVPIVAISEGELERARRLLGMEVER